MEVDRPRLRTEWCVCNVAITAPANDWAAIAEAVRAHQRSPEHVAYRLGLRLLRQDGTTTPDGRGVRRVA